VIATIALKGSRPIEEMKKRKDIRLFEITRKSRDALFSKILNEVKIRS
jgi:nucleoside-triphosphatase THEP1